MTLGRALGVKTRSAVTAKILAHKGWPDPTLPPIPTSGWVDVDAEIDATGATDVTTALNAYIAGLSNGAKIRFPVAGTYRIDGTITFAGFSGLAIDGRGSWFQTADDSEGSRRHWSFDNCDDVYITNVNIDGPTVLDPQLEEAYDVTRETQHAFAFRGCNRVLLEDSSAFNMWGDAVYIGANSGEDPSHITVRNCTFGDYSRQGYAIVVGENFLLEGCTFGEGRRAQIDLEPNGPPGIGFVKIRNNTFGPTRLNFLASGGASGHVQDVLVENNTSTDSMSMQVGVYGYKERDRWTVRGNTSGAEYGTTEPKGIYQFKRMRWLIVEDNNLIGQVGRSMRAVALALSAPYMVRNNTVTNGSGQVWQYAGMHPHFGPDPLGVPGNVPSYVGTRTVTAISGTSMTLTWPTGSQAGDTVFIVFGKQGLIQSVPEGWTEVDYYYMFTHNVYILSRVLSAGDITAGSVSIPIPADSSSTNRSLILAVSFRNAGTLYSKQRWTGGTSTINAIAPNPTLTGDAMVVWVYTHRNGNGELELVEGPATDLVVARNSSAAGYSALFAWAAMKEGHPGVRVFGTTSVDRTLVASFALPYSA